MKSFIKCILQILRRLDYIFLYLFYRFSSQVDEKMVLFLSDSRDSMSGNFYYIDEYIKDEYHVKTHLYKSSSEKHMKKAMCKDLACAKYVLVDDFYPIIYPIPLRKQTQLIQVWHAMGAFKTIGFARSSNHDRFSMTHRNYSAAIVSSPEIRKDYAQAFRMNIDQIYSTGIPRTDIFFDLAYIENKKKELYLKYPILQSKKVILFAPTFRGNNVHNGYYDMDKIDFNRIKEEFSDEYVLIIKMHPFIQTKVNLEKDDSFFLNLSDEREINDLLFITDVLITDYSSVIFEASLLNIPTIFYVYDLEEYIASRDFFYPFEEYAYGTVVKNMDDLIEALSHAQNNAEKLTVFKKKFTSACDGFSTQRFVQTLLKQS